MGNQIEIITCGARTNQGCYLLKIRLDREAELRFGAFRGGAAIPFPAGNYLYLGSARGEKGASSLGYRLLRHATRAGNRPPHAIRPVLLNTLIEAGIAGKRPAGKRLHWHIDHLLNRKDAEITDIIAICTGKNLEARLADWITAQPGISIPAPGLGASDHPGSTHLLAIPSSDAWWRKISRRVTEIVPPS